MRTLRTERLCLREARLDDAGFISLLMNDDGYIELIGDRGVRTEADAAAYLETSPIYDYGAHGLGFNIVETLDGSPVGICGLVKRESLEHVDLGYAILSEHSGRGYATEAAAAALRHAFETLKYNCVAAITVTGNAGSRKVLERIGMKLDRSLKPEDSERQACVYLARAPSPPHER